MKIGVGSARLAALVLGLSASVTQGDDILGFDNFASSAAVPAEQRASVVVDPVKFTYQRAQAVAMPRPGAVPVYAEFVGVAPFELMLRDRLIASGYHLASAAGEGVIRLQLAADYSAVGRYPDTGRIQTGSVDLGKVLSMAKLENKSTDSNGPSALSGIGRDLAANYKSLQISGGNVAGSFGAQALVAGLFDLTGLTGWIQRTHGPDSNKGPLQVVNVWINLTSADGAQQSSRIEAQYTDPILAPVQLASAAFDYALSTIGFDRADRP